MVAKRYINKVLRKFQIRDKRDKKKKISNKGQKEKISNKGQKEKISNTG